ncbi:hypothetical protein MGM1_1410 [Candidatus Malacoplasma girerdii]|uniref:Uncharacterized protein n=1 Tax=Candidatus Malacoplasma girerdii TaxID=1318617 RepID=A0A097SSF7_9BACT|nr:hypothetical protein MGM1_1410 [Candidatus Malacoplasma girerdii]ASJ89108.1 MAG: hypothetical protein B1217_0214 [Candidatus Malacoplasma girerdii]
MDTTKVAFLCTGIFFAILLVFALIATIYRFRHPYSPFEIQNTPNAIKRWIKANINLFWSMICVLLFIMALSLILMAFGIQISSNN